MLVESFIKYIRYELNYSACTVLSYNNDVKQFALHLTSGNIDEFTDMLWNNLNEDNKVSLFVRFVNLENGSVETRIINKNK